MSGRTIRIAARDGAYETTVGPGLLDTLGELVRGVTRARRAALVTDTNTEALFGGKVAASLSGAGFDVVGRTIPAGEPSKSWEGAGSLLEGLAESGVARDDILVALGGGVVGDLAGFCAAVYMRGIPVVQVPTTLLAQVDSSIGGKTGVDLAAGKNLAGAFHAPLAVVADTACLGTLPDAEWRSGLAEVAKSAFLAGEDDLATLERDADALTLSRDPEAVDRAVWMAAGLKARVVSADEHESGPRECLNYGHTLGHAMERVAGYGTLTHGIAVAEGVRFAARLSERVLGADPSWTARQDALLDALGLAPTGRAWPATEMLAAMQSDKKVREGVVRFVLTDGPGSWRAQGVDGGTIGAVLDEWSPQD